MWWLCGIDAENCDYVWDGTKWTVPAYFQAAPALDPKLTAVAGYPPTVTRSGRICTAGGLVSVGAGAQSASLMVVPSWAVPSGLGSNQMVIGSWYTSSRLIGAMTINSTGVVSASTSYGTITSFPTGNAAFHAAWGV